MSLVGHSALFISTIHCLLATQAMAGGGARPPGTPAPVGAVSAQATDSLLNYFKSGCSLSNDPWTMRALADTDILVSTLQNAKSDPNCAGLSGSLGRLNLLSSELSRYQHNDNRHNEKYLGNKQKKQELLLQLADAQATHNTVLEAIIRADLRALQLENSELQGRMEAERDYNDQLKFGRALQNFVIATNSILNQASKSGACLQKNHDILPAMAGVASAAASAYLPTSYAFLATAGTQLLSDVVEFVRINKLDKQISLVNITKLEAAMQCGLESMSEQWCSADEGVKLATLTQQFLKDRRSPDGKLWQAIQVYQRDIPVLKKFLSSVQSGAMPSNTASNERREEVLAKVAFVRDFETFAISLITQNENLFRKAGESGSPSERLTNQWIIQRSVINQLFSQSQSYGRKNNGGGMHFGEDGNQDSPFSKVMQARYIRFYLAGHQQNHIRTCREEGLSCSPNSYASGFENLDPTQPANVLLWPTTNAEVSLLAMKPRIRDLVALARNLVLQERSELVNVDPLAITYGFRDRDKRFQNLTPEGALQNVQNFVQVLVAQKTRPDFLLEDTFVLLGVINEQMSNVFNSSDRDTAKTASAEAIETMTVALKLAEGYDFFEKRLESTVENALIDLVVDRTSDLDNPRQIDQVARFLASSDILSQLQNESGAPSLPELKLRLDHSKTVSQTNLRNFSSLFSNSIEKVVDYNWQNGQRDANSSRINYWQTPYGQQHAQLCFRMLSVDVLPRDLNMRDTKCMGARIISGYEGEAGVPAPLVFSESLLNAPHTTRACTLRNYKRKIRLFENRIDSN